MSTDPRSHRIDIQDAEAIALLQRLEHQIVRVPFDQEVTDITTAYVYDSPAPSDRSSNAAPMLLLPGFDSSLLEFRRLFPLLAAQRETWAVDLIGFGFTDYTSQVAINPRSIRQHLLAVLETWIRHPVILVGASLGGAVAIDFAVHHPDWVRSLVLIDSVGFSGGFPVGQFLPHPLIELGADWLYVRKRAALAIASALPFIDSKLIDALRCSLIHHERPGWKAAIASFTQSGGYINVETCIAQVTHPTLVFWGELDDVLGTNDATRFAQAIAGSQLTWIRDAGHVPHLDQPQRVADHLLAFAKTH
ncbi:MAG TPA: alpha/beta fold hydrolase [Elainellaceae cyanobacterium]|jgi:pimeloyl-ACP methyl ester carboxylesterase